jgi:predicted Zn-dependent protease with MMP-like domain
MARDEFEDLVGDALDSLPADLAAQIDDVALLVEDDSPDGMPTLFGLYQGVPLTKRGTWWAAGAMPDRITIFRNPILAVCATREDVVRQVRVTVVHEVGHYFGIGDARLRELGWA